MKLFEYQAKELIGNAGIPVPKGMVIGSAAELAEALREVPPPLVIKSQVLSGGRGKAGLIRFASNVNEAEREVTHLFDLPTRIQKLLIEEKLDVGREIYISVTVDPVTASPLLIVCPEGGMDIEEINQRFPERIIRERIDIWRGLAGYQARDVMYRLGLDKGLIRQGTQILKQVYSLFRDHDAELVEINPLVITEQGKIVAADAKFNIDDNAKFRQAFFSRSRDHFDRDLEFEAFSGGLTYIHLEGNIGIMSAGAGLTMAVLDLIAHFGGRAANFLEFGGALYERAREAMKITLSNPSVNVVLITTFGLIARADVIAQGISRAMQEFEPVVPVVAAVRGTGEEKAMEILRDAGLTPYADLEEAVKEAVRLSKEGRA